MTSADKKCYLCNSKQRGGSLASDNVVSLVSCDTFSQMNQQATNQLAGGGRGRVKAAKPKSHKKKQSGRGQRGGSDCTSSTASMLDAYTIGPASVPSTLPGVNDGTLGSTNIQASVLASLSYQPQSVTDTYHSIVYPDEFVANNIMVKSMSGGDPAGCMCDA